MKKVLIFSNIAAILPGLFLDFIGSTSIIEFVWIWIFIQSIINACFSKTKKEFLVYNFLSYIFSITGAYILPWLFIKTAKLSPGYHPGKDEELILLIAIHTVYMLLITVIELIIKYFFKLKNANN